MFVLTASFMTEATTYLQQCSTSLSLFLSLSLRYLALSPQLFIDYLTCCVQQLGSLNKHILEKFVLISKVAPIQKFFWRKHWRQRQTIYLPWPPWVMRQKIETMLSLLSWCPRGPR
jgi:hypothetical protein